MQLLEVAEITPEVASLNADPHPKPVAWEPGDDGASHVSTILRRLAIAQKLYSAEDAEDDASLRMLLGMGFEARAAALYEGMIWQPGRFSADGVAGHPDGVVELEQGLCIEEFKYTGKSLRAKGAKPNAAGEFRAADLKDVRGEWLWMHQIMGYVNLLRRCWGVEGLALGRLHVCWKFGKYAWPQKEEYWRYLVRFEEEELERNWAMLQANKEA